jgi:hypothetical protein
MSKTYKIQDGQSVYDIAIQLEGGIDNIVSLLQANNIEGLNSTLSSGQDINYTPTGEVVSRQFGIDGTIVNTSDPKVVGFGDYNLDYNLDFNS